MARFTGRTGPAPRRGAALGLGVLVTFLWATSVVLIRLGLTQEQVPPIGFAGVRFALAALMLLPLAVPQLRGAHGHVAHRRWLFGVAVYGFLIFGVAQLGFYFGLGALPASSVGLLMGIAPVVTAILVMRTRHEAASPVQLLGIAMLVVGVLVYFGLDLPTGDAAISFLAAAGIPVVLGVGARLGRSVAAASHDHGGPLGLTALAMLVGSATTLSLGLVVEGVPMFSIRAWLLIVWMAALNTALAYTLWAQSQRTLRAVESSVLGDLTVIQVAAIGWLVLGEGLAVSQVAGMLLALAGVAVVQLAPGLPRLRRGGPLP